MRDLVLAYKFHRDFGALVWLVAALRCAFNRTRRNNAGESSPAVVTWVPQHFTRRLVRGWDPARGLATALARSERLVARRLLRKRRRTTAQVNLSGDARRRNLRGSFAAWGAGPFPERVILVDDVLTTGASAAECATVLRRAGVREVVVVVVARSEPRA